LVLPVPFHFVVQMLDWDRMKTLGWLRTLGVNTNLVALCLP
jgi:hypothetical protein